MKILIAIPSCRLHSDYQWAQRNTWIKDIPKDVDYKFFLGREAGLEGGVVDEIRDEVYLYCSDAFMPERGLKKYPTLPQKTKQICDYALLAGYDYIFKVDTDTLVNVENLLHSGFANNEYSGGYNQEESGEFCSGGAGYWLSRKAMQVVVDSTVEHWSEDVFVALALKEKGILPVWNSGYRWKPGEIVDKDMITLHLRSALNKNYYDPAWMYKYYVEMTGVNLGYK